MLQDEKYLIKLQYLYKETISQQPQNFQLYQKKVIRKCQNWIEPLKCIINLYPNILLTYYLQNCTDDQYVTYHPTKLIQKLQIQGVKLYNS
ncbi:unnamed protein product [Paramecium octaurelia]|uniref:Uncharacterized protein n=1 Tax=Paramecium octaurelia TaxID=43137 RepID=A0A8S1X817_PAROT|nr:unnamed protein product [Paramecium octaurelia]